MNMPIKVKYRFEFEDGFDELFDIYLDDDMNVVTPDEITPPQWAKLSYFKCPHCPLDVEMEEYCPVAKLLSDILVRFYERNSHDRVKVFVETEKRNYSKETDLQSGVSSMMGIFMVGSGCPIMGRLKPLLHFHLPFGTMDETLIRAVSIFLLSQYVRWKRGSKPDWEMKQLVKYYDDIMILNRNVADKIAGLEDRDASKNSLVLLNNFANFVTLVFDESMLNTFEHYLGGFLNDPLSPSDDLKEIN